MENIYLTKSPSDYPLYINSRKSKIYHYSDTELMKIFKEYNNNKINTINSMAAAENEFKLVPELLMFKALIYDHLGVFSGILFDEGYKINLEDYIYKLDFSKDFNDGILVFKNIGRVLQKLHNLREKEHVLTDFYLGDFHEKNILVDRDTQNIQICDLDGCKIANNSAFLAKYLQFINTRIYVKNNLDHKYSLSCGIAIPNENTDLYCYNHMILKNLLGININILDITNFYKIMYQLKTEGLPEPLFESFLRLYEPQDNINPCEYLDDLPTYFERKRSL